MSSLAEGFIDMAIIILGERKRFHFLSVLCLFARGAGNSAARRRYIFIFFLEHKSKRQKHQPIAIVAHIISLL